MKKNKNNDNIAKLVIIYFVCFLFISTAYSFLNAKLELRGKAGFSEDALKQFNYDYVLTGSWKDGKIYYYQFTINFRYTGNNNITGWQANIIVPTDTEITGCFDAKTCTVSNSILKITNAAYNGTLNSNNQTFSTGFIMKTTDKKYKLSVHSVNFYENGEITNPTDPDDPIIPDEPDEPDEPPAPIKVNGITANLSSGGSWGNTTQFSLTINNRSNVNLTDWELRYSVPSGTKISNIWGAEYVLTNNELILSPISWTEIINAGASMSQIGFQLTSSITPAPLTLQSFTGLNDNYEDVEIEI